MRDQAESGAVLTFPRIFREEIACAALDERPQMAQAARVSDRMTFGYPGPPARPAAFLAPRRRLLRLGTPGGRPAPKICREKPPPAVAPGLPAGQHPRRASRGARGAARPAPRQGRREALYGLPSFRRSSSGSLAMFTAMRRASSRVSRLVVERRCDAAICPESAEKRREAGRSHRHRGFRQNSGNLQKLAILL